MTPQNKDPQPETEVAAKARKQSRPAAKPPRAPVKPSASPRDRKPPSAQRADNALHDADDAAQRDASDLTTPAYQAGNPEAPDPQLLGNLLEGLEEGVAHVSTDGRILYANARFAQLIGGDALVIEAAKTHLSDLMSADCWRDLDQGLKLAAREPVSGTLSVEDPQQRITVRTVRLLLTPIHWEAETTIKLIAREMTEVLEKNRELQEKENSLHELSARIMQLQDEERRRIARDLHDITGQELAVVIMLLMQASRELRADSESLKTITDAASMIKKIEDEIRTLSYVLRPPLLDELGLGAALNWYVEGFTKRSGIEVKVDVQRDLPRLLKEKELALFRVIQEALTNVMRHSGSRTAEIHVAFNAEAVTLAIRDEGKGISRKRFSKAGKAHGVGIMGMRERIQQFGGTIEVHPLPHGTEVVAVMPVGYAEPIETPFSEDDILQMAKALGYKEGMTQPAEGTSAAEQPAAARARTIPRLCSNKCRGAPSKKRTRSRVSPAARRFPRHRRTQARPHR
ncbi:MAG TPA: sensor histidine kinase [Candidatus Acidoferrum sp.]|nr:sensor histidine kinase [Candidatus Acidoferrum sp.]